MNNLAAKTLDNIVLLFTLTTQLSSGCALKNAKQILTIAIFYNILKYTFRVPKKGCAINFFA